MYVVSLLVGKLVVWLPQARKKSGKVLKFCFIKTLKVPEDVFES